MFSLNQSQNTLNQVNMTVMLPPSNITYTGTATNITIEVTPPDAVYSIKNAQGSLIKMGRGNATLHTGNELNMGVNSGASAIYSIHPSGNENYTYVLDNQHSVTGTLTIVPSTITIASSGITSFPYNGSSQTVGYIVSGVYPAADTRYAVSGTSSTDAGSYTATLSETSPNYTLGSTSTFSWGITKLAITSVTWSIASATTSAHNSTAQSVTVSSIAPSGATYSLATTTATNVGSVAKTILTGTGNYSGSYTSPDLTIGAPPAPANFTASVSGTTVNLSWSVVPGCKYFVYRGAGILVAEVSEYSLSTSFAAVADANYTFYVIAQTLNVPTNSGESRTAIVYTGKAAWYTYPAYTGTYANQSPLCLTGSKSGTIGLKSYVQGTYSITLDIVRVRNLKTNSAFATGQITSSTRTIAWNVGGTPTFPSGTANPSAGPFTKAVPTSGTVTITLVAGGSGWSTNNSAGVSGIYWAQAEWRWDGYYTQLNAAIPPTVSYI